MRNLRTSPGLSGASRIDRSCHSGDLTVSSHDRVLRSFRPAVTSCPGCGRTTSTLFRELAARIQNHLEARLPEWRERYPGSETLTVAVMGCVVNGPGESRAADIGISLPGSGEEPKAPVFIDGQRQALLSGDSIADEFIALVNDYVARRWG